jgi:hypothetical protein
MNTDSLVDAVRRRAIDPQKRHDFASAFETHLPDLASSDACDLAEQELSVVLPPLLRRLFTEVANGGFGPGYGILGVEGGHCDDQGRDLVNAQRFVAAMSRAFKVEWLPTVVPICQWGAGIWSCIECKSDCGTIVTLDESGLTFTRHTLNSWLDDWCNDISIWNTMFEFKERDIRNPFTGKMTKTRVRVRAIGI